MSDSYEYYRNLIDTALATEDEEERSLIVSNGIKELVEREEVEPASRDIVGSRIVQKLIELSSVDGSDLALLAEPISKNWFALATDRFSSYVCEDYLKRLAAIPTSKIMSVPEFVKFFKVVCKVTRLNIDECLPHARASHVIRGLICSVGAVRCFPKGVGDDAIRLLSPGISVEFRKRLVTMACSMAASNVISKSALFGRLRNEYAAPVYCTLLKIAKFRFPEDFREDFCKIIAKCLKTEGPEPDEVCRDEVLSHVLNELILATPPESDLFDKLMTRYFRLDTDDEEERIKQLVVDPVGNYCIQTAFKAAQDAATFSSLSNVVLLSMTAIFNAGSIGVVSQMVRAAARILSPSSGIPPLAKHLYSELSRVLSCNEEDRSALIVPCLFYYLPFNNLPSSFESPSSDEDFPPPNLPGCLLLEALFTLPNPSLYVDSLTKAPKGFLSTIASTAEGYHFLSQVFSSKNVPAGAKTEIVSSLAPKELTGKVLSVATTHFGCLTYKAIWDSLPKQREAIASYLSKYPEDLKQSKFGRFLFAAFALRLYSSNPDRWAQMKCGDHSPVGGTKKKSEVNSKRMKQTGGGSKPPKFKKRN